MKQIAHPRENESFAKDGGIGYCEVVKRNAKSRDMADYADMFAAIGAEPRLQILRLLLGSHPEGMVVGDILAELKIAPSTLSHHLEKLKHEGLIDVQRSAKFLRCTVNTDSLQDLIGFLYAECCSRSNAVKPDAMIDQLCSCDKPHRSAAGERTNGRKNH